MDPVTVQKIHFVEALPFTLTLTLTLALPLTLTVTTRPPEQRSALPQRLSHRVCRP